MGSKGTASHNQMILNNLFPGTYELAEGSKM